MGTIIASITTGAMSKVEVIYRGQVAAREVSQLTTHLLVGLLRPFMDTSINVINAPVLAKERGLEVEQITSPKIKEFANVMEVRITTDKMTRTISGTIFGSKFPRVISIDGYRMEMKPEGHVLIIFNEDKPGVLGRYGSVLGSNEVNIADMTFSRKLKSGLAVVGINLDQPPGEAVMAEMRALEFVNDAFYLELPVLPSDEQE